MGKSVLRHVCTKNENRKQISTDILLKIMVRLLLKFPLNEIFEFDLQKSYCSRIRNYLPNLNFVEQNQKRAF